MAPHHSPQSAMPVSPSHAPTPLSFSYESPLADGGEQLWDLSWIFSTLRRKALLILQIALSATTLAAGAIILTSVTSKPKYEGSFQLQVEPATAEARFSQSFLSAKTTERALQEAQGGNLEETSALDYETQIRILQSRKLLLPILEQIQRRYPKVTYELLMHGLKIERVKLTKDGKELGTKLLDIGYTDSDPEQIKFVLGELSQAYLRYSLKERQTNIRQGIKFIDEQLPQLQERVNKLQNQIETLRRQNNLMDPEREGVEFSQLLTAIKRQRVEILGKLAEAQSRYQTLQRQLRSDNAIVVLSEFPSFQKLLDQYQELEAQLATKSARLVEGSPPIESLRRKQENLQTVLNQEAARILSRSAAQVEIAQSQQQTIIQAESLLNQQFQQLPTVARQYAALQQELQVAAETRNRFLSKNEALGIDAAQREVPWELLSPPALTSNLKGEPVNLATKNRRLLLVFSTVLAIATAIGIAFLVELIQEVIYTPKEVKRLSKLPLLGAIPSLNTSNSFGLDPISLVKFSGTAFDFKENLTEVGLRNFFPSSSQKALWQPDIIAFTEAFNVLFYNICFSRAEPLIQSLAISSPSHQEGKSTISIYLAKAAATAGKKVLLVDGDLRSPRLHTYMKLDNSKGLSDLIESELDMREAIQSSLWEDNMLSLWEDNLFVLTAGRVLSNQIGLLSSHKLKSLMQQFTAEFDLVIYDTPPLLGFADLNWISSQVDGFVMAVNLGKTKQTALAQAIESLKTSHIPLLGIVANGCKA